MVKIGDFEIGAHFDIATAGREFAKQYFQQGRFARAVDADQTNAITTHDRSGKLVDDYVVFELVVNVRQFHNDLARAVALAGCKTGFALSLAALAALVTHGLQCADAAFVTRAACLDTLANPDFFLGQFFVEQFVGSFFGGELFFTKTQEALVSAFELHQMTTVDLGDLAGDALEEVSVVGNQNQGAVIFL